MPANKFKATHSEFQDSLYYKGDLCQNTKDKANHK